MGIETKAKRALKISEEIGKSIYKFIINHPQVVQSPIVNDCLEVKIDGYTEPQLVPKLLLRVSVKEIHNNRVSGTKGGGQKKARDEDDNILISDSTLRSLFPSQLQKCH